MLQESQRLLGKLPCFHFQELVMLYSLAKGFFFFFFFEPKLMPVWDPRESQLLMPIISIDIDCQHCLPLQPGQEFWGEGSGSAEQGL